jgi:hypothetical protein
VFLLEFCETILGLQRFREERASLGSPSAAPRTAFPSDTTQPYGVKTMFFSGAFAAISSLASKKSIGD